MPFYNEGDELLFAHNPKGGRPMGLGQMIFQGSDSVDIQSVNEETNLRFHLGYCRKCGERTVMGEKMARVLVEKMAKKGIRVEKDVDPWRMRLANRLIRHVKKQALKQAS